LPSAIIDKIRRNKIMGSVPANYRKPFSKPLCLGMNGQEVERLQDWLNEMNDYYSFCNDPKQVKLSGIFGDYTLKMVMAFQGFWDYMQTGIYDLQTHDLMEWKFYNYFTNELKAGGWGQEMKDKLAEDREKEQAKKNKAAFLRIGKLFKDGRFGK
jgi:hypothetical protein